MSKITVKNNFHKRLAFPMEYTAFSIEAGEIKTVDFAIGIRLLKSGWISEVGSKKVAKNVVIAGCSSCQEKLVKRIVEEKIEKKDTKLKMKNPYKRIKGRKISKYKTR